MHRFGHWYVVGRDRDRDAPRAFRIDRIDAGIELGEARTFEPPAGIDPAELLRDDPLAYGDAQPLTRRLGRRTAAAWVVDELGEEAVLERRDDGSVVVGLSVVNHEAFRTWVLELLEHAEVLAPAELRSMVIEWLRPMRWAT